MVAKKHSFTKTEIKAGIVVLTSLLVCCLFIAVIMGLRPPCESKRFYSEFPGIEGLNAGADVRFGGIKVGKVLSIKPSKKNHSLVHIEWSVPVEIPVNTDSVAYIGQVSIASEKHLEITTGSKNAKLLEENSLVPKKVGSPGMFGPFKDIASTVDRVLSEDGMLGDIRKIMGVKDAGKPGSSKLVPITKLISGVDNAVSESSKLVKEFHSMVKDKRENVDELFDRVKDLEISGTKLLEHVRAILDENRASVKSTIDSAHRVTKKSEELADKLIAELAEASTGVESILKNGGSLLERNGPEIDIIVENLERVTSHLKRFTQILSDRPEALIQGNNPAGR